MFRRKGRSCIAVCAALIAVTAVSVSPGKVKAAPAEPKVHYLVLNGNTEGVLLECNGKFGMVDSGEDNDYPKGDDVRYPYRSGTIVGEGTEDQVITYMRSLGVNEKNFEFYIGTHAHSDHIGSADEIIYAFHPKRVYIQEYDDSYIRNKNCLWDNQYCYDQMIEAAKSVGADLIQEFSPDAPEYPGEVSLAATVVLNEKQSRAAVDQETMQTEEEQESPGEATGQGESVGLPDGEGEPSGDVDPSSEEENSQANEMAIVPVALSEERQTETETVSARSVGENETEEANVYTAQLVNSATGEVVASKEIQITDRTGDVSFDNILKYDANGGEISYEVVLEEMTRNVESRLSSDAYRIDYKVSESSKALVSSDQFRLGNAMNIKICNYGDFYKHVDAVNDANDYCLGVLVSAGGKRVFLSGDINNSADGNYAEERLLRELKHVDVLTLGHHGAPASNHYKYVTGLAPETLVLCGDFRLVNQVQDRSGGNIYDTLRLMSSRGVPLYVTDWYRGELNALVFTLGDRITSNIPSGKAKIAYTGRVDGGTAVCYRDGFQSSYDGWLSSNGYTTYFNDSEYGLRSKKWMKDPQGYWHYFDGTGICKTGWLKDKGKWYLFDHSGNMLTGRQEDKGKTYFLSSSGAMKTGWVHHSDGWSYYRSDGSMIQKGWIKLNKKWYYLDEQGRMLTGRQQIDGVDYYLAASGAMKTGWVKDGQIWRYYKSNGAMVKQSWIKLKKKWYYLDEQGCMLTGKHEIDGKTYFLTSSGAMKTGWNKESGEWYYYGSSGEMLCSRWISGKYYLKEDGKMATSEWVDNDRYYVDANGRRIVQ